ncbi:hypothetical protein AKJ16_DCAP12060 [Drosera capensis]
MLVRDPPPQAVALFLSSHCTVYTISGPRDRSSQIDPLDSSLQIKSLRSEAPRLDSQTDHPVDEFFRHSWRSKVFVPGKLPVDYIGARDVNPIAEFALKKILWNILTSVTPHHSVSKLSKQCPSKRKRKPLTQEQTDAHNKPLVGMDIDTQPSVADEHVNEGLQSHKRKVLTLDKKNDYNRRRRAKRSMVMAPKTRVATAVEGRMSWRSHVELFYENTAEWHRSYRLHKQLGEVQDVPETWTIEIHEKEYKQSRKGNAGLPWFDKLQDRV